MNKILIFFIIFFSLSLTSYSQGFVRPSTIVNNKEVYSNLLKIVMSGDKDYIVSKTDDGFRLDNVITKESFFINEYYQNVNEYLYYPKISLQELLNKEISLDRKTLIGDKDRFVVYGTNRCYVMYGEITKQGYKIIYTWECN